MVVTKNLDRRWYRRYKTIFIIGIIIFALQLYLALKFLMLHGETTENDKWNPYKISGDINDLENSVNSARRLGLVIDDEDIFGNSNLNDNKLRSKNDKTKSNVQSNKLKLNNTVLRVEDLDFIPGCDIRTKEAISAIHRAKTQRCKQELVNVTCLAQKGLLYPKTLSNFCPSEGMKSGKSLGCFKDEKNYRILNGYYANLKTSNSPEHCIQMCLQSGYPYAGVQYSTECFCGNDEPSSTSRLPDSSCNMKCPTNPHLACGGYFTINVFETGIAKFTPQIALTPENKQYKPVRIVFLLTLNGRALRQVHRLIKTLFHQNNYFYIHVDSRQDYLFRELLPLEQKFANIKIARKRFSTIWGGASLLKMLLTSMQELLDSEWNWDFVINLSESDYPVKTVNQLVEFLSANKNKNFVKSHGREVQRFIQKQGLDKTFVECDAHMWRQGDRKLPWGIQIDGGSDWVALSRPFVEYVASKEPDELVTGLIKVFQYTLLPAESFFHTALRNSKFCNAYVDNNLHVTNWKRKLGCKCQYKHVVDWCGCSPNDFRPDDWLRIQGTEAKQLYFARKFEPIINQAVILQVEEWLYGPAPQNLVNLHSYWQNVYHWADLSPQPDDALLTLSRSITRNVAKLLSQKGCQVSEDYLKILEVITYQNTDNYEGSLISYEVKNNFDDEKHVLQTLIKPRDHLFLTKSNSLVQRIQTIFVSSDYDQKEQVSRNFIRILGPFSEPALVYTFLPSLSSSVKLVNLTFLWIDPTGQLLDVTEAAIDEQYSIGYVKPVLKPPLLPGIWTVKMIYKKSVAAQCNFLITPLEIMSNTPLTQTQASFIHSGSVPLKEFDQTWSIFLPSSSEREILMRKSLSNSKRFDLDLREWIDSLINKFYKIKNTCLIHSSNFCSSSIGNGFKLNNCSNTNWSSKSPDPKSFIGKINSTTGYLEKIW